MLERDSYMRCDVGLDNIRNFFFLSQRFNEDTELINERDLWVKMLQIDPTVLSARNCSQQGPKLWQAVNTVQIPMRPEPRSSVKGNGQGHARKMEVGVLLILSPIHTRGFQLCILVSFPGTHPLPGRTPGQL